MIAILGNRNNTVKPWYLFGKIFCRTMEGKLRVVKNDKVKNIPGLPVIIMNGKVVKIYSKDLKDEA